RLERVRVIDWERPEANDFLLVSQFSVTGALYTCRPDLVGFVNGLPLVVIELKKPGIPARQAFAENLTHYKQQIPALFAYNALLIASNGTDSRVGSLTADWERFFEWKRIEREDEPRRVSLEVMLRGTCDKTRLLDLLENFTLFSEHKAGLTKIIGQNHQFLGVNNAISSILEAREAGHGRGGVFWQTQGSGKSFSMVFFSQKILRKYSGNWTFVVVTDRVELDDQIAKTFKAAGAVSKAEGDECHASSCVHLRELLRGNHRFVFTLVHKFQTPEELCDRKDVIVLTDEAHRSQYDTLALNMRAALPNAMFVAFTGTPLIAGEERTKEVFGDYVSIYDFQQSVEDGATVPLYYENRTPELQIINPDLNEDIYDVIEAADLDADQEAKLEKQLGRQYHILTRDDRLDTVAHDIVRHFLGRGFVGKAMVVSIDKATALKMHDKVRKAWSEELKQVKKELLGHYALSKEQKDELLDRLQVLQSSDMALIVSPGQNEIQQMLALGLDIEPHRRRMHDEDLGEKFRDPDDPLRLVFLCAMWLTGFDAPSCSTVYLDKPMRNHTLMQTIARANRVFPGKHSGVIVDYANVFASLEKALAIYGQGSGGETPVRDKQQLVDDLRTAIQDATDYCSSKGVDLEEIENQPLGDLHRLQMINDAMNALIAPDDVRKEFLAHERLVSTLYKAVKPDPAALEFSPRTACLTTIADAIRATINPGPVDISKVMGEVQEVLDNSITDVDMPDNPVPLINLSKIDFEKLRSRFKKSKHKSTDLERLKAAIRAQLEKLIRFNKTRTDYLEKFEEMVESYNNGSRNIEQILEDLLRFAENLSEEQQRHVREHLSEEELTVFDILTRPGPELSTEEREEVKKVAHEVLDRLNELLALDWRLHTQARAKVKMAIEDELDQGLPRSYTPDIFQSKCSALFEHVYESYYGEGSSIYEEVGA
ncbi:MAG: type I restriction endonuclease subunit R, partial [Kiritimatiellae bacterium]|nr:type I restriction endonuclease subunit R [Kiritimatiellia bacterium]